MKTIIDEQTYKILDFISDIDIADNVVKYKTSYNIVTVENNFLICSNEKTTSYLIRKFFNGLKDTFNSIANFISDNSIYFFTALVILICVPVGFVLSKYIPANFEMSILCSLITLLNLIIILLCTFTNRNN